jgi:hypothetical protein
MLRIGGIYTIRDTRQPHYWDIVFEWEDQMAITLGVPLIPIGKKFNKIYNPSTLKKILNRINFYQAKDRIFFHPKIYYIAFHIGPPGVYSFYTRNDVIPVIIDFWKYEDLRRLESIFQLSKIVLITSREVFNYLSPIVSRIKVEHLALSLPDKYLPAHDIPIRDIDIIQIGRRNATFDLYMNQFLAEFPDTHYVSAKKIGEEIHIVSNQSGDMGIFAKREDFMSLLRRSKVSLVSAPGLDEDKSRTGGFSPVTPRFLESAACGCKLLALYLQNADFDYYKISQVAPVVTNYKHFRELANEYLMTDATPDYSHYLQAHLTSKRAKELLNKLQKVHG